MVIKNLDRLVLTSEIKMLYVLQQDGYKNIMKTISLFGCYGSHTCIFKYV